LEGDIDMEYHLSLPIEFEQIKKLKVGDILYVTGRLFTARDEAHHMMLHSDKIPFDPSVMGLYHCGPLMKKEGDKWKVVSAGPTTSSRMEIFEDEFIKRFGIGLIIGKGGMGERTEKALQKYICIYTSYTGGAGALAADKVKEVENVFCLDELGMPEAIWIMKVKEFGHLLLQWTLKVAQFIKNLEKNN